MVIVVRGEPFGKMNNWFVADNRKRADEILILRGFMPSRVSGDYVRKFDTPEEEWATVYDIEYVK